MISIDASDIKNLRPCIYFQTFSLMAPIAVDCHIYKIKQEYIDKF